MFALGGAVALPERRCYDAGVILGRRDGLSLVEVMVVTGIASLISLLLLEFFLASRKVTQHGAAHTEIQQSCRHLINRLSSMVVAATSPIDTQDAIPIPAVDDAASPELAFYSPDDLFGNVPFDPRNPSYHFYRVRRDGKRILLDSLQDDGTPRLNPPPRQLALAVDGLEFERPEVGLIRVRVWASKKVPGAKREIAVNSELRTTLSIPFYTW